MAERSNNSAQNAAMLVSFPGTMLLFSVGSTLTRRDTNVKTTYTRRKNYGPTLLDHPRPPLAGSDVPWMLAGTHHCGVPPVPPERQSKRVDQARTCIVWNTSMNHRPRSISQVKTKEKPSRATPPYKRTMYQGGPYAHEDEYQDECHSQQLHTILN